MNTPICKNCVHFHQHYVLDKHRCTAIDCGHCSYPHLKHRRASAPACVHFTLRTSPAPLPDREEVVNFLTVDLLRHIMTLELPPEITESADL